MTSPDLLCRRCGGPVQHNRELFEVLEGMHWICFHLEYEHEGDADSSCGQPSCFWWQLETLQQKLRALGHDPEEVLKQAREAFFP